MTWSVDSPHWYPCSIRWKRPAPCVVAISWRASAAGNTHGLAPSIACAPMPSYRTSSCWPKTTGDARPARRGTASVVLVDGAPALHVEPGGGSVLTFSDASDDALMRAFSKGLPSVSGIARRALTIESIDGAAALSSRWAPVLDRAGLRRDYRGFVAITSPVANSWNAPPDEQAD